MITLDQLKEGAAALADSAVKTTGELYQKGKKQVDLLALENKLAKAQRQLGALVYSLHKNQEENTPLLERYMDAIAAIESEIEERSAQPATEPQPAAQVETFCPQCGAQVDRDAVFCLGCGAKL